MRGRSGRAQYSSSKADKFLLALADSARAVYVAPTLSDANLDSDLLFRDLLLHSSRL